MKTSLEESLSAAVAAAHKKTRIAGLDAAIHLGRDVRWRGFFGSASPLEPAAFAQRAAFPVYSITKSFMAALALRLVEAERLVLDNPAGEWLPDVAPAARVTVRQLLNHTSGILNYGSLPEYTPAVQERPSESWTFDEFLRRSCEKGFVFPPGRGWAYSNTGYMLLRRIIETAADRSFADAMRDHVLAPLGLGNSFVVEDRAAMKRLTPGYGSYLTKGKQVIDVRAVYDPGWVATGLVASTAAETAAFLHGFFGGSLVGAHLVREAQRCAEVGEPHPRFRRPAYGLGFMADLDAGVGPIFGHVGDGPGYCAAAFHSDDLSGVPATVAILCNTEGADQAETIVLEVLGELKRLSGTEIDLWHDFRLSVR